MVEMFKKKIILVLGMLILCSVALYFVRNFQTKSYEKLSNVDSQHSLASGTQVEKAPQSTEVNNAGSSSNSTETAAVSSGNANGTGSENSNKDGDGGSSGSSNTASSPKAEATPVPTAAPSKQPSSTPAPVSTPAPTPASTPTPTPTPVQEPNLIIIDTVSNTTIFKAHVDYDGKTSVINYTKNELTNAKISFEVTSGGYMSMIAGLREKKAGPSSGWIFYVNGVKSGIGAGEYIPKPGQIITWKYWKDALNEKN